MSAIIRADPQLIVHPNVPWPVLRNRLRIFVFSDDRRPIWCHRSQTGPEGRGLGISSWKQVHYRAFERSPPRQTEVIRIAGNLGHSANTDALAKTGNRDLVGFVQSRRFRRARRVVDRHCERIAFASWNAVVTPITPAPNTATFMNSPVLCIGFARRR